MRLAPNEIKPGMWVALHQGTGMVLDIGKGPNEKVQLGVILEFPPTETDYFIVNLYHHDFIEVEEC
jgi:hypothetical protein